MIEPIPRWAFTPKGTLTQSYGHVHLLPGHALGQWCNVDRQTGQPLWERKLRANSIRDVSGDVIVATETVSFGPGTWSEGCYGVSLTTGQRLWTSHAEGFEGRVLRWLDAFPEYLNRGRDTPVAVVGDEVICRSGRVLSVRDGRLVRRISRDEAKNWEHAPIDRMLAQPEHQLYGTRMGGRNRPRGARIEGLGWLTHRSNPGERVRDGFRLYALDDRDRIIWSFDLATTGYRINHCNYHAYRFAGKHVYIVAAEGPNSRPAPAPYYQEPIPTTFHLLALEFTHGTVAQDVVLTPQPTSECRIEDVDAQDVLISTGRRHLAGYRRSN
jgi:hypothetical protein